MSIGIFQKRHLTILVLAGLLIFVVGFWAKYIKKTPIENQSKDFQTEFNKLSSQTKDKLDLRNFKSNLWDEALAWEAYVDICNLGINGFSPGGSSCRSLSEDSECRLVFLKNNYLVAEVEIDRSKMDLCTSKLPSRIAKRQMNFKILSNGKFPKVSLAP